MGTIDRGPLRATLLRGLGSVAAAALWSLVSPGHAAAGAGGPDEKGYCFLDSLEPNGPPPGLRDMQAAIGLSLSDDQLSEPIPLGFQFSFYGKKFSAVRVSSNGFLRPVKGSEPAGSTGCCGGHRIPMEVEPNGVIAGYWTDLDPSAGGSVRYLVSGPPGQRVFTVEFAEVPHQCRKVEPCPGELESGGKSTFFPSIVGFDCEEPPSPCFGVTFQLSLFEASNRIVAAYGDVSPDPRRAHAIGIEDPSGRTGLQVAYGNDVVPPSAIEYLPPGDSDGDGLSDCEEAVRYHTRVDRPDSDGDGFGDGFEVNGGTCQGAEFHGGSDPNDAASVPVLPIDLPVSAGPSPVEMPLVCP